MEIEASIRCLTFPAYIKGVQEIRCPSRGSRAIIGYGTIQPAAERVASASDWPYALSFGCGEPGSGPSQAPNPCQCPDSPGLVRDHQAQLHPSTNHLHSLCYRSYLHCFTSASGSLSWSRSRYLPPRNTHSGFSFVFKTTVHLKTVSAEPGLVVEEQEAATQKRHSFLLPQLLFPCPSAPLLHLHRCFCS
jgi:hypothetical protein